MSDLRNHPHRDEILEAFESRIIPEPNSGCWLWSGSVSHYGYGFFTMRAHGFDNKIAHRVAWQLYRGPIPEGIQVLHKCDVRGCVDPGHLFLGTNADNRADMVAKGRQSKGETHGPAKLTERQALAILRDTRPRRYIAADCKGGASVLRNTNDLFSAR